MIARLAAKLMAPTITFERGAISTREEAQAAQAVLDLEARAAKVSQDLMSFDGTAKDLNPQLAGDVFAISPTPSGYVGHAVQTPDGQPTRLRAETFGHSISLSVDGDRKEISSVSHTDGPSADQAFSEEWATFDGNKVSYKRFEYWAVPKGEPHFKD
jgi:hypothetical protein